MESITEELKIRSVSHFNLYLKFEFTDIEISQVDDTWNDLQLELNTLIDKFKSLCEDNGFRYVEIYVCKFLVPIEGGVALYAYGDLHEPFTPYLEEKLKAVMTVTR